jgi:hypothetical protein
MAWGRARGFRKRLSRAAIGKMRETIDKARAIAAYLEIGAPDETASADDWRMWVAWWEASYEAARGLSEEQKRYLKAGGWWPPVTASHIQGPAPEIVIRTRRPSLFVDQGQPQK